MLEPVDWASGEYRTDHDWDAVNAAMQAHRNRDVRTIHGMGRELATLGMFGRTSVFNESGKPVSYQLASITHVPFPGGESSRRGVPAGEGYHKWDIKEVDPRSLVATQSSIRSDAFSHYLDDSYKRTGELYDKTRNSSNDHPVVVGFQRQNFILTGHHRAAAALVNGEPLMARYRHIS